MVKDWGYCKVEDNWAGFMEARSGEVNWVVEGVTIPGEDTVNGVDEAPIV